MKIIRADHLGMCFGVRDAIELALAESREQPLTILGDLVHNESVMADLESRGVVVARRPDQVAHNRVMITAHGASEKAMERVRAQGRVVLEATCPLVHVAHRAVRKLANEGYHVVVVGKRDHVEVRGLTEDLNDFDIILSEADVDELPERAKFGVAAQTTQPIDKVRRLVECLRERFPNADVRFVDTVCQPTKQRQQAAIDLAKRCDVVIVVGGKNSNNTHELVQSCSRHCARVHHIQTATDLQSDWLAGAESVGITAGTSTPDWIIVGVEQALRQLAVTLGNLVARA